MIISSRHSKRPLQRIVAADEEFVTLDEWEDPEADVDDSVEDTPEEFPEEEEATVDDIVEDPVDIEGDNNIADHYIAECEACHGVFISAVIESDQELEYVSGICPLCQKQSDQKLKWVIKEVEHDKIKPELA